MIEEETQTACVPVISPMIDFLSQPNSKQVFSPSNWQKNINPLVKIHPNRI